MVKWLILCGNEESWDFALKNKVWGIRPNTNRIWNELSKGDIVFFYVTRSLKRIIGVGKVKEKLDPRTNQPEIFFPDEVSSGQVIYPNRFEFETIYVWKNPLVEGISIKGHKLSIMKGINRILDEQTIHELQRRAAVKWSVNIPLPEHVIPSSN